MSDTLAFPRQALPDNRKGKAWQKKCLQWGDSRTYMHYSPVRRSVRHKQINFDLLNGKLHMEDVIATLNPSELDSSFFPETIQHFPIINSKIETLVGEELQRPFDWQAVVTNMNAVSDIEEKKKEELANSLKELLEDSDLSEEEYLRRTEEISEFYEFDYQDIREIRANELLKHYIAEYNMPLMFNAGFRTALTVGEECYFNDIVGGVPVVERVNINKLRIYRNGYSNKIEDADIIIYEDYWSVGKILDVYGDQLTEKDVKFLDNLPSNTGVESDSMGNIDHTRGLVDRTMIDDTFVDNGQFFWDPDGSAGVTQSMLPFDEQGNVRVMRMFWKSRRRIKKVKMYDPETGEEYFDFFTDAYVIDENFGEEEAYLWVNEAWEGTMIGGHLPSQSETNWWDEDEPADNIRAILVNVRPRPVQYPDMDNPSKCSLGFVGTIYNFNDDKPYSMVDMMKPYSYLYDVIHYRLMDAIAASWGALLEVDIATMPEEWDVEKWMYFARVNHITVKDSFREGNKAGTIAGALNNNSQRMISDANGNYIQQLMELAAYVKNETGEMVGITRQREGQISNRETVGGVERSVLQSSYITERYFALHRDTVRRELSMFLETAKIAMKGRKMSFRYKVSNGSWKLMEIDGDEFAENNYGIIVDSSSDVQNLNQKIDALAQAAMQNSALKLSALMKIYSSSSSLQEKIKIIERSEKQVMEEQRRAQQEQMQANQQAAQAQMQIQQAELQTKAAMNTENNETNIMVAQIQAESKLQAEQLKNTYRENNQDDGIPQISPEAKARLDEQIREFNLQLKQDDKKIAIQKERNEIARMSARKNTKK